MYKREVKGWAKHLDFLILDLFCLQSSMSISYMLRHSFMNPFSSSSFVELFFVLSLMDFSLLILLETLKDILHSGSVKLFLADVKQAGFLFLCATAYMYLVNMTYISKFLLCTIVGYTCLTYIVRLLWKEYLIHHRQVFQKKKLLLMASKNELSFLIQKLRANIYPSVQLSGLVLLDATGSCKEIDGIPVVATKETIISYVTHEWVDEILLSICPQDKISNEIMIQLVSMGVTVHMHFQNNQYELESKQVLGKIAGLQVITNTMNYINPRQAFLKRSFDILGAIVGCLITGLLCLFLAPAIKWESPGPIFFSQTRIGKNGKAFKIYKFRSMYMDAEERKKELMSQNRMKDGLMFKMDFDPRIIGNRVDSDGTQHTGIGEFIRKYSLDEFPQFFNVLLGDMSLVGTRPPVLSEYEHYSPHHKARLAIKPGITGLWQTSGRSNILDFEEVVKLDTEYINNWSIGLDLKILLKTVKVVLKKEGSM